MIDMTDFCDKCNEEYPVSEIWFAYCGPVRVALCNTCYAQAGRPVDYWAMKEAIGGPEELGLFGKELA